jgi:Holliday junction resolvasome RuvABC endonuclease subunit
MTRFVGIDYSTTSSGVAVIEGESIRTFTLKSKPAGPSLVAYYERIRSLAADIMAAAELQPGDVVAIEGIAFAGRGAAVDRLHYSWHRTVELLSRVIGTELVIVTTNQVKQLATGRGNAQKDDVLLATERRLPGAQVAGNDEADAVWVAVGASILHGEPVIELPQAHVPKAWKHAA